MSTETIGLLIVIALIVVALPMWPYSKSWGYAPTGILSLLMVAFVVWAVLGQRPLFRKNTVGEDIRAAGQDVADSIRDVVK